MNMHEKNIKSHLIQVHIIPAQRKSHLIIQNLLKSKDIIEQQNQEKEFMLDHIQEKEGKIKN